MERELLFPHADAFWKQCNEEFSRLHTSGASEILETNYGFNNSLAQQLEQANLGKGNVKVVYNASGHYLKAARISCEEVVSSKCYWIICGSIKEARYLVGVINAPNMQDAWRRTKTSNMDFHKAPFRVIPVPRFEAVQPLHLQIAEAVKQLENREKDDLNILNQYTSRLLPNHVT